MVDLSTIARIVVGLLLLWAAAAKLRRRHDLPDWLAAYGVPKSEALSYALVLHATTTLPFLVAGGLILNVHGVRYGRRRRSAAAAVGAGVDQHDVAEAPHGNANVRDT